MSGVSFIGASNIAWRYSLAMHEKGICIHKIYNRTPGHRDSLVKALRDNGSQVSAANSLEDLMDSDIVFIAVNDDAIETVVGNIAGTLKGHAGNNPIFIHTSGATDINVFAPLEALGCKYGVLYPVMTLRKNKNIEFSEVPFLIESPYEDVVEKLESIAKTLGSEYYYKTSEERLRMHVAAVFVCNFVNYILDLGFSVTDRDHCILLPSAIESVRNCFLLNPASVLTGPAKRKDMKTIQKHMELLEKLGLDEQKEIYELLSRKIIERQK